MNAGRLLFYYLCLLGAAARAVVLPFALEGDHTRERLGIDAEEAAFDRASGNDFTIVGGQRAVAREVDAVNPGLADINSINDGRWIPTFAGMTTKTIVT